LTLSEKKPLTYSFSRNAQFDGRIISSEAFFLASKLGEKGSHKRVKLVDLYSVKGTCYGVWDASMGLILI
jgi:hypothetical protein